jgi:hypothetical protein
MKLLETLGIKDPALAAAVLHHEYISDRSVALLQRETPNTLRIGSGTCFKIGEHYLIATVAHNVSHLSLAQIEAVPRGAYYSDKLTLKAKNHLQSIAGAEVDLAWIEVEASSFESSPELNAFSLDQIAIGFSEEAVTPCFLQGFPGQNVALVNSNAAARPSVESDGLLTLSIPPSVRSVRHQSGVDLAIEYPPHDGSVDHLPLPEPPGNSGGGIWLIPGFEDGKMWLQSDVKLLAIARRWYKPGREVWGTRIDLWLKLVSKDFEDLREEIESTLDNPMAVAPQVVPNPEDGLQRSQSM